MDNTNLFPDLSEVSETKAPKKRSKHPVLEFQNINGIEVDKGFNTFRAGRKWFDTLKDGDVVDLVAEGSETAFGEAEVVSTVCGDWNSVKTFASDNHAVSQFGPLEAQSLLLDQMKGIYPLYDEAGDMTVIYLKRTV